MWSHIPLPSKWWSTQTSSLNLNFRDVCWHINSALEQQLYTHQLYSFKLQEIHSCKQVKRYTIHRKQREKLRLSKLHLKLSVISKRRIKWKRYKFTECLLVCWEWLCYYLIHIEFNTRPVLESWAGKTKISSALLRLDFRSLDFSDIWVMWLSSEIHHL